MSAEPMSELRRYTQAMMRGFTGTCIRIEQDHDLFGYPPEIVCVGLRAFDEGKCPQDAVAQYITDAERAA